jgi:polysaccharide pyruvyl transferase WcaK-like protein
MKILVEQSGYHLNNMGDVAMLQVTVSRLKQLFPESTIQIFTTAPDRLEKYCPGTVPLSPLGREVWSYPLSKFPSRSALVNQVLNYFDTSTPGQEIRKSFPHLTRNLLQHRLRNCPGYISDFNEFTHAIFDANLVILSGGGYINDVFPYNVTRALATIDLATRLHKPVIMLGHGLGPLTDVDILAQAQQTLPSVKRIGLREQVAGLPLLKSIGVSPEQVVVTGDDAVELAYEARSPELDRGIGVNLRVSHYSEVAPQVFNAIRAALVSVAETHQAPLIPAPISRHSDAQNEQPDSVAIQKLTEGYSDCPEGGFHLDTPLKVIQQVSRCRVMVTASYHAGVFALSQGIPVVGLVKSKYYVDKFQGLADQFGQGCEMILLDEDNLQDRLIQTINQLWSDAETLRPKLLESAVRQIQQGRLVYQSLRELGLPCR